MDINKAIADDRAYRRDPDGHLEGLAPWSVLRAGDIARELDITLEEGHWVAVCALREHVRRHGPFANPRQALLVIEEALSAGSGRRRLYELFPGGPVRQACLIAGLPLPPGTLDPSFGSVH